VSNVAQDVGWAIFTEGATAQGSLDALKEQLLLEWADILNWLLEVSKDSSEQLADEIVKALLKNGLKVGPIDLPDVSGRVEQVNYPYEINLAVPDDAKSILSWVYDSNKPTAKLRTVNVPHWTFWFSITKRNTTPRVDDDHYLGRVKHFVDLLQKGPATDPGRLADKLSRMLDIKLDKARSFIDGDGSPLIKSIRATFTRALSNALEEARRRHRGSGVFDFTDSRGAKDLERIFRGLTIGNDSEPPKVRRLIVDVVSASMSLDVDLISRERLTREDLKALWNEKEEQASKLVDDGFDKAEEPCEKAREWCRSMSQLPVCGSLNRYAKSVLKPLSKYRLPRNLRLPNPATMFLLPIP
jgi:hypothetical protein